MTRVLLDEGIPRGLALYLRRLGLDTTPFPIEWRGISDRELFDRLVREGFDVLVTQDRNMPFQRPLSGSPFAVLIVPEMDRRKVLDLGQTIAEHLPKLEKGRYALFGRDDSLPDQPTKPL